VSDRARPDPRRVPSDAAAHAFVTDLDAPVLTDVDRHHLERVRRLRPGEVITVADGSGRWRACRFGDALTLDGAVEEEPRPGYEITIAFAPVKADRPEWVVQKLTELGVDTIAILATDRAVVRWNAERAERNLARLAFIAREAAMQCRRATLPSLVGPVDATACASWREVARADRAGPQLSGARALLIGPEGGWSDRERAAVPAEASLGSNVLRAETAALAAATLLATARAVSTDAGRSAGH
jgi:16S rRNA (uracil1498-N3)-methyltransferase